MNDRVADLIKKILAEPSNVEDVIKSDEELYFKFGRFFFSVAKRAANTNYGRHSFYIYPRWTGTVGGLVDTMTGPNSSEEAFVAYHSANFPEDRTRALFVKLYELIYSLFVKVDAVFEELLGKDDDDIPF